VPSVSDADFRARATFHRMRGHGVQEAYDITLGLLGATTIDGVTVNFKVTDGYFNPESYNYSESLQTPSGVTGYRYDNRFVPMPLATSPDPPFAMTDAWCLFSQQRLDLHSL
jgi:hypothetical protein